MQSILGEKKKIKEVVILLYCDSFYAILNTGSAASQTE